MKQLFIFLSIICLAGCKKEYISIYSFPDMTGKVNVKFVHAVPNALVAPANTAQAGFQIYLGDTKVTGVNVTYGGGVFPGLEYSLLPSGSSTLKAVIPAGATTPETTILNAPVSFTEGKTYTAVITDTLPTVSFFLIEENFAPIADSGKYFVRLINASPKSAGYDLFAVTDAATIAQNVQYKTASNFVQIFAATGARTFAIRKPGTTANIATVAITPTAGRMYSILSHGIDGVTTGARSTRLTFFTTRFQN